MKLICKDVKNTAEAESFVAFCERDFESRFRDAARRALSLGNKFITLSGPTCSGKTTTASVLLDELEKAGKSAVVISIDDFYLDDLRTKTDSSGDLDFDSVNTIDIQCLAEVVQNLARGDEVKLPKFDFLTGKRSGYVKIVPRDSDIYIFEGIQAVYPEVSRLFGDGYTSVFITVADDVMFNGVYFSASEIRLLRRIVRDADTRNTSPSQTLAYWDKVRKNEDENIFPNAANPHIMIDSFLIYELFVIAPIALAKLAELSKEDAGYSLAHSLSIRLSKINSEYFSTSFVPKTSVFREFIGSDD